MAKDGGFGDLVRRVLGRPDEPAPGASGGASRSPSRSPGELPPGRRPTPQPLPPEPEAPRPDPLTDGHWERRVFELERTLLEKNRSLLRLEEEVQKRDERLKEAFSRLRDAEETVEIQHKLALLPVDATGAPRPPSSEALQRLATEKGELLTRERKLRSEIEALRQQAAAAERTLRARDASLAEAQTLLESHQKDLADSRERLRAGDARKDDRERTLATERDQAVLDARGFEERLRTESAQRAKAEHALIAAEQQAALYRKNLLGAEESQRARSEELDAVVAARDRLEIESRELHGRLVESEAEGRRSEDGRKALQDSAGRLADELASLREAREALLRAETDRRAEIKRLGAQLAEAEVRDRRRTAEAEARELQAQALGRDLQTARSEAVTVDRRRAAAEQTLAAERAAASRETQALREALERMTAARDLAASEAQVLESAWLESSRLRARAELEAALRLAALASSPAVTSVPETEVLRDVAASPKPLGAIRRLFRRS